MNSSDSLRPHDVALLIKLISHPDKEWMQKDLASELGLSQGEIAKAMSRLKKARLVLDKGPIKSAAFEFLIHAVKFAFPVEPGPLSLGVPTAISAPMHKNVVKAPAGVEGIYIWPYRKGKSRGQAVRPLYPNLPEAALKDEKFYEMMSALEMLRIGRARERSAARAYFEKELKR